MLVFDIETTGLNPDKCTVTVVCTQDYHTGEKCVYEFARTQDENPEDHAELVRVMAVALDAAPALCAFNGVRFDIPFLAKAFKLPQEQVVGWVLKTSDILEQCRLLHGCTFSLNMLCEANGVQVKSSNGLEAVHMALRREWQRLREYCADDVQILCDLYRRRRLVNPRTRAVLELADVAPPGLYAEAVEAVGAQAASDRAEALATLRRQLMELERQVADMARTLKALETPV